MKSKLIPKSGPVGDATYPVEELIAASDALLNVHSYVAAGALYGQSGSLTIAAASSLVTAFLGSVASQFSPEDQSNKDQHNGYAGLDGSGLLKVSELPLSVESRASVLKTSAYTVQTSDSEVLADLSSAAVPFTLPTASGSGRRHKLGADPASVLDTPNLLSILPQSGDTIGDYNLPAPTLASATAAAASGALDAATYYGVVTAVSDAGETLASNELSAVVAAALLQPPVISSVTTATTGGSLPALTYTYFLTARNAAGETIASAGFSIATTGSTSLNTISWGAVAGATSYVLYRNGANSLPMQKYVLGNVTTITDGAAWSSGANGQPPDINTTGAQITWVWNSVPGARYYRFYRGTATGGESSMYEVFGTTFIDKGAPPLSKNGPPVVDSTLLTVGTPQSGALYSDVELVDAAPNAWRLI